MFPIVALLLPAAAGAALGLALGSRRKPGTGATGLTAVLLATAGICCSPGLAFAWLLATDHLAAGYRALDLAVCGLILLWALARTRRPAARHLLAVVSAVRRHPLHAAVQTGAWLTGLGLIFYTLTTLLSLYELLPDGMWDAWAIWNVKAKFIYGAGPDWPHAVSRQLAHPDYPLLQPLAVARLWSYLGDMTPTAPMVWSCTALAATGIVLLAGLMRLRGPIHAVLACLVLLVTPCYVDWAGSQYADTTLAMWMLCSLVCLAMYSEERQPRWLFLLGLFAAAGAWTKNEGQLFAVLTFAGALVLARVPGNRRQHLEHLLWLAAGSLPLGLCLLIQKLGYGAPNDLIDAMTGHQLRELIADPQRYREVLTFTWQFCQRATAWDLIGWIVLAGLLVGLDRRKRQWPAIATLAGILAGQLIAYELVFIAASPRLTWHLGTAFDRLMLQLTPGFLFCLMLPWRPLLAWPQPPAARRTHPQPPAHAVLPSTGEVYPSVQGSGSPGTTCSK